jgi:hypothetical protein
MSKKKKKGRKAAKKRARALKSITKAVGLTIAAFSAGAFQNTLKRRAVALVESVLGRIGTLRETYAGTSKEQAGKEQAGKEQAGSRRESRPNGVTVS